MTVVDFGSEKVRRETAAMEASIERVKAQLRALDLAWLVNAHASNAENQRGEPQAQLFEEAD